MRVQACGMVHGWGLGRRALAAIVSGWRFARDVGWGGASARLSAATRRARRPTRLGAQGGSHDE